MKKLLNDSLTLLSNRRIIILLLSILGFVGCSDPISGAEMYGLPPVTYRRATVNVKDVDNKPLQGVDVALSNDNFIGERALDYRRTDTAGKAYFFGLDSPRDTLYFKLRTNRKMYRDTVVKSLVLDSEYAGGKYVGDYHKELSVTLEKIEAKAK